MRVNHAAGRCLPGCGRAAASTLYCNEDSSDEHCRPRSSCPLFCAPCCALLALPCGVSRRPISPRPLPPDAAASDKSAADKPAADKNELPPLPPEAQRSRPWCSTARRCTIPSPWAPSGARQGRQGGRRGGGDVLHHAGRRPSRDLRFQRRARARPASI